jgi:hypothetical protein
MIKKRSQKCFIHLRYTYLVDRYSSRASLSLSNAIVPLDDRARLWLALVVAILELCDAVALVRVATRVRRVREVIIVVVDGEVRCVR